MSREDVLKKVINIYSDIVEENTGEKDTIMIRRCSESWITYICILRNTKI